MFLSLVDKVCVNKEVGFPIGRKAIVLPLSVHTGLKLIASIREESQPHPYVVSSPALVSVVITISSHRLLRCQFSKPAILKDHT